MNININTEITDYSIIEGPIRSCVEFAERNHCSVRIEIDDIPILISHGDNFSVHDCVDFFEGIRQKREIEFYKQLKRSMDSGERRG